MSQAWEINEIDIIQVLSENGITKSEAEIQQIYKEVQTEERRINEAVMLYGEPEDQSFAFDNEIEAVLKEKGYLPD